MTFQQISVSKLWNLWTDLILQTVWFSYRSEEGAFFPDYPVDPQFSHIHPYKREAGGVLRDTLRRRRWCEDGGWDWSDVAWRHRTLAASRGWTRQRTDSPRSLWSEGGPVNTLFLSTKSGDPSFWSSGLQNYERIPVVFSRRVCDNFLYRETDIPSTKSKRAAKPDWVTGLGCPEGVSIYYTAYYYKSRVMNFDWSKFLWSSLAGNPPNLSPRLGPAPETLLLTLLPMDSTPAPR